MTPATVPGSIAAARWTDVVLREELGEFGLEGLERAKVVEVGQFDGVDVAVVVLGQDEQVDQADRACLDQRDEFVCHLAGEITLTGGELDDDVVDGSEFVERVSVHVVSILQVGAGHWESDLLDWSLLVSLTRACIHLITL